MNTNKINFKAIHIIPSPLLSLLKWFKNHFLNLYCAPGNTVGTLMNRMCIFSCKTMGCECGYTGCMGFPGGSDSKESSYNVGDLGLDPWVGKIPWRREWKPSLIFLPGEWTEEPGGLQSMGSQRARHNWVTNTFTFSFSQQINVLSTYQALL